MPESLKFLFASADGHELAGRLERPEDAPHGCALFAHCFTCSKDVAAASRISKALAHAGLAVLRFDFTGLGNSEGDFSNTNFSSNVGDLVAAAQALRREFGAPSLLVGHSLGGAAVLRAAQRLDDVRVVATIGAPSDPAHVRHLFGDRIEEIEAEGCARVTLAGRTFQIRKQFLDDLEMQDGLESIRQLKSAVVIFHSPVDELVSIDHARKIYEAAGHPKSFVSLDRADHLLTQREDSQFVAEVLAAFASRHVR